MVDGRPRADDSVPLLTTDGVVGALNRHRIGNQGRSSEMVTTPVRVLIADDHELGERAAPPRFAPGWASVEKRRMA
jgi:hypothetical protein